MFLVFLHDAPCDLLLQGLAVEVAEGVRVGVIGWQFPRASLPMHPTAFVPLHAVLVSL
jgi:hypothetical protein